MYVGLLLGKSVSAAVITHTVNDCELTGLLLCFTMVATISCLCITGHVNFAEPQ